LREDPISSSTPNPSLVAQLTSRILTLQTPITESCSISKSTKSPMILPCTKTILPQSQLDTTCRLLTTLLLKAIWSSQLLISLTLLTQDREDTSTNRILLTIPCREETLLKERRTFILPSDRTSESLASMLPLPRSLKLTKDRKSNTILFLLCSQRSSSLKNQISRTLSSELVRTLESATNLPWRKWAPMILKELLCSSPKLTSQRLSPREAKKMTLTFLVMSSTDWRRCKRTSSS